MDVLPWVFDEDITSRPSIVENCFSSGVATAEAIVSGLAPGRLAKTWITEKSTLGRSLTGSLGYEITPNRRIDTMTSVVITGLRMKISEMFTAASLDYWIVGLLDCCEVKKYALNKTVISFKMPSSELF
jgi:hypothetical protein